LVLLSLLVLVKLLLLSLLELLQLHLELKLLLRDRRHRLDGQRLHLARLRVVRLIYLGEDVLNRDVVAVVDNRLGGRLSGGSRVYCGTSWKL